MKIDFDALNSNMSYQYSALLNLKYKGIINNFLLQEQLEAIERIRAFNDTVISKYGKVVDTTTMTEISKDAFYKSFLYGDQKCDQCGLDMYEADMTTCETCRKKGTINVPSDSNNKGGF